MIRPITCVGFVLACASGFYLYQTKHRVTVIDHEIADAVHQTGVIRKQIPILAAEWALLNAPDRIQQLVDQYSTLKPTDPSQFAALDELDSRLPPIPSPDGTPVAGAAPPSEPPSVPSSDVVAQNAPVLMATAQVPPATRSVPAPSPAAVTIGSPAPSPAAATAESQPANQDTEDARPAIDVSEVRQPHGAEASTNQLAQTETSRVPSPAVPPALPPPDVNPAVSSSPAATAAAQPSSPAPVAAPVSIDVAQSQPQPEVETAQASSPSSAPAGPEASPAPAAPQPSSQDAEAARLAAELAQLKQQHEAEAAQNRLLHAEADRLAAQIAHWQKSLEALRAQAAARQPLPVPAIPPPAVVAATQAASAGAARVAAELAQLKQQHDAEAATNRRLQEEVDRLAMQMGQQQKFLEVPRPKLASAKPLPTPAAPVPSATSFNTVESIVTRLRHETLPPAPAPHELPPPAPHDLPPPAPSPPAVTAQFRPQVRVSSPWVDLMDARAALGAGDTYETRARLAAAQSALLSQPSRRHYFAATQISMAVALINAGANLPALHFLDLAIANAGGGVPYAAENVQPPQPMHPPWAYQP